MKPAVQKPAPEQGDMLNIECTPLLTRELLHFNAGIPKPQ
jgi:hypothetical protein